MELIYCQREENVNSLQQVREQAFLYQVLLGEEPVGACTESWGEQLSKHGTKVGLASKSDDYFMGITPVR